MKPLRFLILSTVALLLADFLPAQHENFRLQLERETGIIKVQGVLDRLPSGPLILALPTWGPGQRNPSRSGRALRGLKIFDADRKTSLSSERLSPQRWLVQPGEATRIGVEYEVMAGGARFRRGPRKGAKLRHTWVEPGRFLMGIDGHRNRTIRFSCDLPEGWSAAVNLPRVSVGQFQAVDRRSLEAAPLLLGEMTRHRLEIGETEVEITAVLDPNSRMDPDWSAAGRGLRRIFEQHHRVFSPRPRGRYLIQLIFGPREDGVRGYAGTAVIGTRERNLQYFPGIFERANSAFLRTWIGGALRSTRVDEQGLGPYEISGRFFDDGFMDYYDKLFRARTGYFTEASLRAVIESEARIELAVGGRRNQTLLDAGYSRDQSTINPRRLGFLFGLALDLEIRQETGGEKSLDDVMRFLLRNATYQSTVDVASLAGAIRGSTGYDPELFFKRHLEGSIFPPLARTLLHVGFEFRIHRISPVLPFSLQFRGDGAEVRYVDKKRVGKLDVLKDDFVVAIDGQEDYDLARDFSKKKPGESVRLRLVRQGKEHEIEVKLVRGTRLIPTVREAPNKSPEAQDLRRAWLGR